ncbi:hypothetical protein [Nocardia beijingensis]|uniref:Uncharacterized protein n=1 Tax=Nocardia beijingensis TaxID=95162 RepID=A0ABW7WI20_9NOCA
MFTGEQRDELIEYLRRQLAPKPGVAAGDRLLASEIREKTDLIQFATDGLRTGTEYSLIDNQIVAYEDVMTQVKHASEEDGNGLSPVNETAWI